MKQPATMQEAKSMVKERWLDRRVDKLSKENDKLREAVGELRLDLDEAQGRSKETLAALSKTRRPGRLKWIVLAGGAYVLGAKAGRARYEQLKDLGAFARAAERRRSHRDRQRDGSGREGLSGSEREEPIEGGARDRAPLFRFSPWRLLVRLGGVCRVVGAGTIWAVKERKERHMAGMLALSGGAATLLWILAVVLVIMGIVSIVRGGVLAGIVLVIVGLLVGPGGVSLF